MKDSWTDYPLAIMSAAVSTTFGAMLVLILSLNMATAIAFWVLEDEVLDLLTFLLAGLIPICMACLQLWGFAYVFILVWLLHRLLYADSFRLPTALVIAPLHLAFTLFAFIITHGWSYYSSAGVIIRALAALLVLLLPLAAYGYLTRSERGT